MESSSREAVHEEPITLSRVKRRFKTNERNKSVTYLRLSSRVPCCRTFLAYTPSCRPAWTSCLRPDSGKDDSAQRRNPSSARRRQLGGPRVPTTAAAWTLRTSSTSSGSKVDCRLRVEYARPRRKAEWRTDGELSRKGSKTVGARERGELGSLSRRGRSLSAHQSWRNPCLTDTGAAHASTSRTFVSSAEVYRCVCTANERPNCRAHSQKGTREGQCRATKERPSVKLELVPLTEPVEATAQRRKSRQERETESETRVGRKAERESRRGEGRRCRALDGAACKERGERRRTTGLGVWVIILLERWAGE